MNHTDRKQGITHSESPVITPPPMMRLNEKFASLISNLESDRWIWQLPNWPEFTWDMAAHPLFTGT